MRYTVCRFYPYVTVTAIPHVFGYRIIEVNMTKEGIMIYKPARYYQMNYGKSPNLIS